jgi:molybdate transport system substrate-binding protein
MIPVQLAADQIRIATASNFKTAMVDIATLFEQESGHEVMLISGSSGKHYAQIVNGAPFDAFFSADEERPIRLEKSGLAIPGSRFTYAIGKLVLWSPQAGLVDAQGAVLNKAGFRHLAIANPDLAPYGRAAKEVLLSLGVWDEIGDRLVRGENVNQAFQFVHSRNAELGLVAFSQLKAAPAGGSYWLIPQDLYQPIRQQAVLLSDKPAARDFLESVQSEESREMIAEHGYQTVEVDQTHVQ